MMANLKLPELSVSVIIINLIKNRCLLYLCCYNFFFCNNILFGVMSCNLSFIFDSPIIYARQLNILTKQTTALGI